MHKLKANTYKVMLDIAFVMFGQYHPAFDQFVNWASAQNDLLVNLNPRKWEILTGEDFKELHRQFVLRQIHCQPLD